MVQGRSTMWSHCANSAGSVAVRGASQIPWAGVWAGLFAPAGTPAAIVQRLDEAGNRIVKDPTFVEFLRSTGGEPAGGSSEDFRKLLAADVAKWTTVVKDAGIQPE